MRHLAKFHHDSLNGCRDVAIKNFQNGRRPSSWISNNSNFQILRMCIVAPCVSVKNHCGILNGCGHMAV